MKDNPLLEAALRYASRGWRVLPIFGMTGNHCDCNPEGECHSGKPGKHPLLPEWPTKATTNEKTLRGWWKRWLNANVALLTGEESGFDALDLDNPEARRRLEEAAKRLGLVLPPTITVSTARGNHLYFRHISGVVTKDKAAGVLGLDVKGDKGYVLAPPSRHASGITYQWVEGKSPERIALASLPQGLVDFLLEKSPEVVSPPISRPSPSRTRVDADPQERYFEGALRKAVENVRRATEGTRNHTLNREALSLARRGVDREVIRKELGEAAKQSGLGEKEIASTLRSAFTAASKMGERPPQLKSSPSQGRKPPARAGDSPVVPPPREAEQVPPENSSSADQERGDAPTREEDFLERVAPLGNVLYTMTSLRVAREKRLLSVAELPEHHGWGEPFNRVLGGGLSPGVLIAIGAASAGAGKTSFLMQLADGLALRNLSAHSSAPITPVVFLSEMSPEALAHRRLAWLTEERASTFRAGITAERYLTANLVDEAYRQAERLLTPPTGQLYQIQSWQRQVLPEELPSEGATIIDTLRTLVTTWRKKLGKEYPGREIWPVVVVDPVQRWLPSRVSEVEGLNDLAKATRIATDKDRWITFLTSDTNKTSAKGEAAGDPGEMGATLFRGSYSLVHNPDVAFYLGKPEGHPEERVKTVPIHIFKNRLGPNFQKLLFNWDTPTGRFRPLSEEEQRRMEQDKAISQESTKKTRTKKAPIEAEKKGKEERTVELPDGVF